MWGKCKIGIILQSFMVNGNLLFSKLPDFLWLEETDNGHMLTTESRQEAETKEWKHMTRAETCKQPIN